MNGFTNYEEMAAMVLFGIGFTTLLLNRNLVKKIIGFSMMDSAIYLFLAAKGYINGRVAPIVVNGVQDMEAYINPIPAGREHAGHGRGAQRQQDADEGDRLPERMRHQVSSSFLLRAVISSMSRV